MVPDRPHGADSGACPQAQSCEMYGLFALSGTLALWQVRYCEADYSTCARYQKLSRNEPVPRNLLPNGSLLRKGGGR